MPYCLGGRSLFKQRDVMTLSSVDCSALVQLAYHACGLLIPRIFHTQFLQTIPINPVAMQPGDLVFFKRKKKDFLLVGHVAMYLGNEMLIEFTEFDYAKTVRTISMKDYFGASLHELSQGYELFNEDSERHAKIFFGTMFASEDAAANLRKKFINLLRDDFSV